MAVIIVGISDVSSLASEECEDVQILYSATDIKVILKDIGAV